MTIIIIKKTKTANMTETHNQAMEQGDDTFDCLQGQVLFGKYLVGEKIGSGSQGSVFDLQDQ